MQKYFKLVLVILIPVLAYMMSFGISVHDSEYYTQLTKEYSQIDASQMNTDMVEYFKTGELPASFQAFSEKEKTHLEDVRKVIHSLILVLMALTLVFILLLNRTADKRTVFFYGGIITIVMPLLFFLPFDLLFTQMHNILFAKGSWVFPADALLVRLYPLEFFYAFAKCIVLRGFCLGLVITALSRIK